MDRKRLESALVADESICEGPEAALEKKAVNDSEA
jgi:hypothetical protein